MPGNPFSPEDDLNLAMYLAKYYPEKKGRSGNTPYTTLFENQNSKWSWAKNHPAQSWRERYVRHKEEFQELIQEAKEKLRTNRSTDDHEHPLPSSSQPGGQQKASRLTQEFYTPRKSGSKRIPFTRDDQFRLVRYLAIEAAKGIGRSGNEIYQDLMIFDPKRWNRSERLNDPESCWQRRHTWHSWREHYTKRRGLFDKWIERYQALHDIKQVDNTTPLWRRLGGANEEDVRAVFDEKAAMQRRVAKRKRESEGQPGPSKAPSGVQLKRSVESSEDDDVEEQRRKRRRLEKQRAKTPPRKSMDTLKEEEEEEVDELESESDGGPEQQDQTEEVEVKAQEQEEEPSRVEPPPSDDYEGEIFEDDEQPTAAAEETVRDDRADADETERMLSEPPAHDPEADEDMSPERDLTPTDFEHVAQHSGGSLEHTLTRNDPDDLQNTLASPVPVISQVIPSPEALQKLALERASPVKVSQEPTPPTSDVPKSPLPSPKREVPKVHVARQASADSSTDSEPSPSHRAAQSMRKRKANDEDFFESLEPEHVPQSSLPRPRQGRQPPVRVEGAFNSAVVSANRAGRAFRNSRRISGTKEQQESSSADSKRAPWPPIRKGNKGKAREIPVAADDGNAAAAHEQAQTHHAFSQPTQVVPQAAPTTITHTLDTIHHPFSQPTQMPERVDEINDDDTIVSDIATVMQRSSKVYTSRRKSGGGAGPSENILPPELAAVAGPSRIPAEVPAPIDRRHTMATPSALPPPVTLKPFNIRRSLPSLRAIRASLSADSDLSSHTPPLEHIMQVLPEDQDLVYQWGIESLLQHLSKTTGFNVDIVEQVWQACGTLAKAEKILLEMAEDAVKRAERSMSEENGRPHSRDSRASRGSHGSHPPSNSSNGRRGSRSSRSSVQLKITPVPPPAPDDEYWPPDDSKAAIQIRREMARETGSHGRPNHQRKTGSGIPAAGPSPYKAQGATVASSSESESESEDEDEDEAESSDGNEDSRARQARRILNKVRRNRK